jgi:hypothetical protein
MLFMALYTSSSPWPKDPFNMKVQKEIERVGLMGRPKDETFHFPFLSLFSSPLLSYYLF